MIVPACAKSCVLRRASLASFGWQYRRAGGCFLLLTTSYCPAHVKDEFEAISDLILLFSGDGDFNEWIRKIELVAELQEVKGWEKFVHLFLSGGAFSI